METKKKWQYKPYTIEEITEALNREWPPMSDEEYLRYCRDNVPSDKASWFYHEMGRRANLPKVKDDSVRASHLNASKIDLNSTKNDLNSSKSDLNSTISDLNCANSDLEILFENPDESPLTDVRFGRLYVQAFKRGVGYLCRCDQCGKNELVTPHGKQGYSTRLSYLGKRKCPDQPRKGVATRVPDVEAEHLGKTFGRLLVTSYTRGKGYQCLCTECGETETVKPAAGRSYLMLLERAGSRACGSK